MPSAAAISDLVLLVRIQIPPFFRDVTRRNGVHLPDRVDAERLRSALDCARVPAALLPGARCAAVRHIRSADTLICTVRAPPRGHAGYAH